MFDMNKKSKMKSDKQLCRLTRLLDVLMESAEEFPTDGAKAVICDDGVVIFGISKYQTDIMMIKDTCKVNFSMNLTEEEMQEFNGGKGLSVRYTKHKE